MKLEKMCITLNELGTITEPDPSFLFNNSIIEI